MSALTRIEWTDRTWNPLTGCTKVSPGCDNCYAKTMHERFNGPSSFDTVTLHPERLGQPLRWRGQHRVFVNSMSDLFHKDAPDQFIAETFGVMASAAGQTFQVLTKRHARMRSLLNDPGFVEDVRGEWARLLRVGPSRRQQEWAWPLPNVWLGVSVEDQQWADIRIPKLLDTPAAVRFLSCEPLLGPIDLRLLEYVETGCGGCSGLPSPQHEPSCGVEEGRFWGIDWVIVGGESGPGARPMHPNWPRSLRVQCAAAGVPFLFKQWGAHAPVYRGEKVGEVMLRVGKKAAGRELDGRTWDEYPAGAS